MTKFDPRRAREALKRLPEDTNYGSISTFKAVYLPRSHLKAMDLNAQLVTGMRGAGKTFWWSALQWPQVQQLVGLSPGCAALSGDTVVKTGFGFRAELDNYPSPDVLARLMTDHSPRAVWRTVIGRQLAQGSHPLRRRGSWQDRVAWTDAEPEAFDRLLDGYEKDFDLQDQNFLILFDALDRSAQDWKGMYRAIRGLLQTALDMRSYSRLRVKIFLRTDQIDETLVADFPDASKIFSSSVELSWSRKELYGLLWHCLANDDDGEWFRTSLGGQWNRLGPDWDRAFHLPRELVEEDDQRIKFHDLSGPYMGTNHRRGYPYSWIPTHLGDSEGRASPRSFLAALRTAAYDTEKRRPGHRHALHYESIKYGVQEASKIRVREIREDHPWIHRVLEPLDGASVPIEFGDIRKRWRSSKVLKALEDDIEQEKIKLPPRHMEDGPRGIREDLEAAGVFQRLHDGRVNIPDIFRVGYGLRRKGGVKPVR